MIKTALDEAQLKSLIKKQVITVLREFLGDPDFGCELTEYAKKRIRHSMASVKAGKISNLDEILKKHSF
jgi:acyl-CoA hydrolase